MITSKKLWTKDKQDCLEYTVSNGLIELKVLNVGGTITSLRLMDDDHNIVVAYKDKALYKTNPYYLGSNIGPIAGRVHEGYTMDGEFIKVDINEKDRNNQLHGGSKRIDLDFFEVLAADDDRFPTIVFIKKTLRVEYVITMRLYNTTLLINHKAIPQTKMPLNITNHMYFNLGKERTIEHEILAVDAKSVLALDENMAPTSRRISIQNTPFDFRGGQVIGPKLKRAHDQFDISGNIDHYYELEGKKTATLYDPKSRLSLNISTTGDAFVIYMANYFDGGFVNELGEKAANHSAVAIEPMHFPLNIGQDVFYDRSNPFEMITTYALKKG